LPEAHDQGMPRFERVAVARALAGLGDLLCLVPALRALRQGLPHATVTLVGLPPGLLLLERFPWLVDDFLAFPGFPGIPEGGTPDSACLAAFPAEAQARRFDLALQMHGSGTVSNRFTLLLGAERAAGFFPPGGDCPDPEWFLPYPEHEPEVRRNLALVTELGLGTGEERLELAVTAADWRDLAAIDEARALRHGAYACVHPGASIAGRRWPADRFAAVADALARRGLEIVLTGTAAEAEVTHTVASLMRRPALDLAGRTSLGALAALLAGAAIAVTNDTGTSHLAAALETPSVVVFTGSDPLRWAPLDRERHRALGRPPDLVAVGDALAQAELLLDAHHTRPDHVAA
jgi:ADP-heptose:LPS heptosyltransferase